MLHHWSFLFFKTPSFKTCSSIEVKENTNFPCFEVILHLVGNMMVSIDVTRKWDATASRMICFEFVGLSSSIYFGLTSEKFIKGMCAHEEHEEDHERIRGGEHFSRHSVSFCSLAQEWLFGRPYFPFICFFFPLISAEGWRWVKAHTERAIHPDK